VGSTYIISLGPWQCSLRRVTSPASTQNGFGGREVGE